MGEPSATSVLTPIEGGFGGNGGMGEPSATRVLASSEAGFGGNGGMGEPSATSVLTLIEGGFGGNGGIGQPSALRVRSIVTGLPAERLTDRIIGSTIKIANTKTATTNAVFFKGRALLEASIGRGLLDEFLCLKTFRMRNRSGHENAYPTPAKP